MFDILVFLFEQYYNADFRPDFDTLSRKLTAAGFDDVDISEALDWLADLDAIGVEPDNSGLNTSTGLRVYTEDEVSRLDAESRGFICFLENAGTLTPRQRELIVDRLMALSTRQVSLERTRLTTLMVLWSQRVVLDALLVEELLNPTRDQMH